MNLIEKYRKNPEDEMEIISTLNYTPIEILTYKIKNIGKPTDIWQFGIIMHVIIFDKFLIKAENEEDAYAQIKHFNKNKPEFINAMKKRLYSILEKEN